LGELFLLAKQIISLRRMHLQLLRMGSPNLPTQSHQRVLAR
jgi:hypothetical protein